ncbi:cytochrome c oxidase assembly protein [Deinococcus hopiensis]|uniref:Cytochrome c oxidase assembly factor CtaG n=1 Tax=Deinococcus hopiensis KR-140 TaxID=695939 RepID=A0A1W1VE21_9DEIO|nr:cytochrome c oxidase assembly protein [Deinococcus hopiensis]SMB91301.1 Cytochrome c oxidase assembly factor CtaG [Deinococcus hopiensis KR-140]
MSAPLNLNPGLGELLALRFDVGVWLPVLVVSGLYLWRYAQVRRTPQGQARWPIWKVVLFLLGLALLLLATQSRAVTMTRNSMALYMTRLMVLAEVVPPLLVLGVSRGVELDPRGALGRMLGVLLDPWVALAVWAAVIIFWNVPAGFNASVVTNTASALLPALYLLSSLLVWSVVLRPLPAVQQAHIGARGWFGLLAALPMMSVAAVWLYSPQVLYTPYASALCLWNLTPLQNQQISGWIMMLAGLPAMGLAFIQLMAWLIRLADGEGASAGE